MTVTEPPMGERTSKSLDLLQLPIIGVLPNKFLKGAETLSSPVPPLDCLPFDQAMVKCWDTDAHFCTYQAVGTGQRVWPRCRKSVVPRLRAAGADLISTCIALDWDRPGHARWVDESEIAIWFEHFIRMCEEFPLADDWAVLYSTRAGMRLVYLLDQPLQVEQAEARCRWMIQQMAQAGMAFDPVSAEWSRVFRLPYVIRDGVATWEGEIPPQYRERLNRRLPIAELQEITRHVPSSPIYPSPSDLRRPTPEQATDLLEQVQPSGAVIGSEFLRVARHRLRGRECYSTIFEHTSLANEGNRNVTIMRYVGQVTAMLCRLPDCTVEHIYALLLPAVQQLQPDADTPDWCEVLWSACCRIWFAEMAKLESEKKAREEQAEDIYRGVLAGMRQWCEAPALMAPDNEAEHWASRHLIASIKNTYYIMRPDGTYDSMGVNEKQLFSRITALGMDAIIQLWRTTREGTQAPVGVGSVINRHATVCSSIEGIPQMDGATIREISTDHATFRLPLFRRNPHLRAQYDEEVDLWLQHLFGHHYDDACKWIGYALAFEEGPICALSISGDPGCGKKMLAQGLAECLEQPRLATAADMVSGYQYGLMESPFLIVNEGWPQGRNSGMHPRDQFRSLVGGDGISAERKYETPVKIKNPVRILFTANNLDVAGIFADGGELSPQDRAALAIRILHFDVGGDAAKWLQVQGGIAHTGAKGRRWIEGDGGERSDFIVARHFLWLYEKRHNFSRGHRLLVEGNQHSDLVFSLRTRAGATPLVIEILMQLLRNMQGPAARKGICVWEDSIFVLTSEVLAYFREQMNVREKLTAHSITKTFASMVVEEPRRRTLPPRRDMGSLMWYRLDPVLLQAVASRDGWHQVPVLTEMAERLRQYKEDK